MPSPLEQRILDSKLDPAFCVMRHITRTSRLVVAAFDDVFRPQDLTGHQFNVLITLARGGPMSVNTLAGYVGMHPSTTPRVIAPLVRDGLMRVSPGKDRREKRIAVTKKGEAKLLRAYPGWVKLQEQVLKKLGAEEFSATLASLKKIRQALS